MLIFYQDVYLNIFTEFSMGIILLLSVIGGLFLNRSVKMMCGDLFSFMFIFHELKSV